MSTWLTAWRNRETDASEEPVIELRVVAGADSGSQFTVEGPEVVIGRGEPRTGETSAILLEDRSISRKQALIRREVSGVFILHVETASNPTFLNGDAIDRAPLSVGDRIEMGRVAIEVCARTGTNLSGLTEIMSTAARAGMPTSNAAPAPPPLPRPGQAASIPGGSAAEEETEIRPMQVDLGEITILRGFESSDAAAPRSFPIGMSGARIGRSEDAEIRIGEAGVSRRHAEIVIERGRLVLRSMSRTNPTLVNGFPVLDSVEIADGDEIQLADRVVLGVRLHRPERSDARNAAGLSGRMADKIDLDRSIEAFNVMGTFLDVDVVGSRGMKGGSAKAEHIIVSFDRFRDYVGSICEEWGGQVLNSNGDELMCFFESASSAVLAGSAILERLEDFNRSRNLLTQAFRFRIGAHTGVSLVDLDAGVAYSEVLDTAGHIQKLAEPDTLVVSQATLDSLPARIETRVVGELTGEGRLLHEIKGPVRPHDLEIER